MNYGTVGKVLAGIGALLMLRAMTMSVVGGTFDGMDFANISLMNERSNTLMLGGFLLIAGVILYAVSKLKQTPADEQKQAQDRKAAMDQLQSSIGSAKDAATTQALLTTKNIFSRLIDHFRAAPDMRVNRLATGIFVGLCVGVTFVSFLESYVWRVADLDWRLLQDVAAPIIFAVVGLTIWRAFSTSSGYQRIRNLHLANIAILATIPLNAALIWMQRGVESQVAMIQTVAIVIVPMLVSIFWIYLCRPGKIY